MNTGPPSSTPPSQWQPALHYNFTANHIWARSGLFADVSVNCILSHNQFPLTEELARPKASLPVTHRILASRQVKRFAYISWPGTYLRRGSHPDKGSLHQVPTRASKARVPATPYQRIPSMPLFPHSLGAKQRWGFGPD